MNAIRTLAALALVLSTATACNTGGDSWDYYGENNVQGRMVGDLPQVDAFDDDTRYGTMWRYDGWMDMEMNVLGDYGWAMLIVNAELDDDGNVIKGSETVIGCSGPDEGEADFDEPSEDEEVDIEKTVIDGEDVYEITINADFAQGGTVAAYGVATINDLQ